jgi:translation initiation factor IF-3
MKESQGGHISVEPRINERIRVPEVRLVGPNGEQVGIVSVNDALRLAQEADLDLVEVAPTARPPVCKLMDYGKFKYESALKARESRKNQAQTIIKEIKLRPKIDPHDYGTKKSHVERFLRAGDKVKVTIMFRGREQSRPELGFRLLQRLASDVEELGFVEAQPRQDGRNMIMVIGPHRRKSEARAERSARDPHQGERAISRGRAADMAAHEADMAAHEAELAAQETVADDEPAVQAQPAAAAEPAVAAAPAVRAQPAAEPAVEVAPAVQAQPSPAAEPPVAARPAVRAQPAAAAEPAPAAVPKPGPRPAPPSRPKPEAPKPGPRPPAQSRPKPEAPKPEARPKPPSRPRPEAVAAQARPAGSRAAAPEAGADS